MCGGRRCLQGQVPSHVQQAQVLTPLSTARSAASPHLPHKCGISNVTVLPGLARIPLLTAHFSNLTSPGHASWHADDQHEREVLPCQQRGPGEGPEAETSRLWSLSSVPRSTLTLTHPTKHRHSTPGLPVQTVHFFQKGRQQASVSGAGDCGITCILTPMC